MKLHRPLAASIVAFSAMSAAVVPQANAKPAPEVEYAYDVTVRRHYDFPNGDAIGYGYAICDRVSQHASYGQLVNQIKSEVAPDDEFAVTYLVSYAVNMLCPAQIPQLRNSAAGYRPAPGDEFFGTPGAE